MSVSYFLITFLIVLVLGFAVAVVSTKPYGNRILGCAAGAMLAFTGILGIIRHRVFQQWGGGPPIEGSFATACSVLILAGGLYAIFASFSQKPDDQSRKK